MDSLIAPLISSAMLTGVFAYLYVTERERHLAIWSVAFAMWTLRYVYGLSSGISAYVPAQAVIPTLGILRGLFILWGAMALAERRMPRWWLALVVADFGFLGLSLLGVVDPAILGREGVSHYLLFGIAMVWAAVIVHREVRVTGGERVFAALSIATLGLLNVAYPWSDLWSPGVLAAAFHAVHATKIGIGVGIILLYFKQTRLVAIESGIERVRMQERLEESRRHEAELEKASEYKSQFLANMSHEIRTPIGGVIGLLELMGDEEEELAREEHRTSALGAARSLLTILNDILDFSKIEAGRMEIESIPFSVAEVAEDVGKILEMKAAEKGIDFEVSFEGMQPPQVLGDPGRVRQILVNLAGNAVKFTSEGTVGVHVAARTENGTTHYRIDITDTGIGISEDNLGRLFEEFIQAEAHTSRRFGGTGLGLSISKQLARLMGGDIEVSSVPGEGSTFTLVLDLDVAVATAATASASFDLLDLQFESKVLLAEDNEVNQVVVGTYLESLGCRVTIAGDGKAALDAWSTGDFDLVFMDCQMPEMDGFTATGHIREREDGAVRIPVIALTANAMEGDRERCLAAGMDDYLTKPVDRADLAACLARWTMDTAADRGAA